MTAATLLIEDNEEFAESLRKRLARANLDVDWEVNLESGYHAFAVRGYELVIADYNLKDSQHGLKLLMKVKALSPGTRLILISGELDNEAEQLVAESGIVDAYLVKGPGITDVLLKEAEEAAERDGKPTDWPALAKAILTEQDVDYGKAEAVDRQLSQQIDPD